ncbi:MAG TPA: threonine/serine exporter family protein [Alloiococcus sp.]|nr:threonine/serine exporter family protein [Alloiococcus sp.]
MDHNIFITTIAATFTTLGFAILYNIPRRHLPIASIIGGMGWMIYYFFMNDLGIQLFASAGLASLTISVVSQLFARKYAVPVTIFSIPAIIPLVPGGSAYNGMRAFIMGEYAIATGHVIDTFIIAGAIALGLTVNTAIFQVLSPKAIVQQGRRYLP